MAEIRIEKKERSLWPWLLGLLLLLLGIWAVIEAGDDDYDNESWEEVSAADVESIEPLKPINDEAVATAVVVREELDFEDEILPNYNVNVYDENWDGSDANFVTSYTHYNRTIDEAKLKMNLDHDYANPALRALAFSLSAFAREAALATPDFNERIDFILEKAH
ncbi:MAG: hypothetical protein AAFO94_08445, partial [Bacteroidota bacterium]